MRTEILNFLPWVPFYIRPNMVMSIIWHTCVKGSHAPPKISSPTEAAVGRTGCEVAMQEEAAGRQEACGWTLTLIDR